MKKHKTKIISSVAIISVLIIAWFWGDILEINEPSEYMLDLSVAEANEIEVLEEIYTVGDAAFGVPIIYEEIEFTEEIHEAKYELKYEESDEEIYEVTFHEEVYEKESETYDQFATTPEAAIILDITAEDIQIFEAYHPEMREPVEPEDMVIGDGSFTVTLSVRVHTILYNMHLLHHDKHELVPIDGWIFSPTEVIVYEGESVFNVLQREMRRNGIHMVSRPTLIFNSAYVEAINNLFEFDVGPLSGWMYSVNGWFPNFGASRYLLSDGDVIEWVYTVDLGRDLGVYWLGGE